ncbi:MAG TPA: hypothetical protein VFL17_08810 [Anaerolineae bacterium]|nr:hypothetical protein [Anaerolineae bacterium]
MSGRSARWRERLAWIAPIGLASLVVCSGCLMLLTFALTARTELEAQALGSDWRVWQLQERGRNGIGVSQTHAFAPPSGAICQYTRTWLISWRPALLIESFAYEDCGSSGRLRAHALRL